ncbi:MAG: HEAT repeat domain-containing protein [Myxococcales bacterium]|nr:HEAT repeat domain-containing protein [Myxococcales bacterium]MCB9526596.1 HEAT repeat domain-containing protein [Myxococcales bacterium]
MRPTELLALTATVVTLSIGCRSPEPPKGKAGAAKAVASADVTIPPVPVDPPRPQQEQKLSDLDAALSAAHRCLRDGRLDRRCPEFRVLRTNLKAHQNDEAWLKGLQAALARKGNDQLLALQLYADGAMQPADKATYAQALLALVDDPTSDEAVRQYAVGALDDIEDPAVSARALALFKADKSDRVQAAAGYLLGKPAHAAVKAQATAAMLDALKGDAPASVKRAAVQSLAKLEHAPAIPALIGLLDDELVGANAIMALAAFDDPKAYGALFARIEQGAKTGQIKPAVLAALVRLQRHKAYDAEKVAKALEGLIKALEKTAPDDRAAGMARDLAQRHLKRIQMKLPGDARP